MGKGPRKWIKVFCYETLHGSVSYQLSEEEQAVWVKMLCLAGLCGNEGLIADHDRRPFPETFIIHELKTTPEIFKSTMDKCKNEGRISEDGQGIMIVNWSKYQSEYDRQKKYRQRGSHLDETPEQRKERLAASHNQLVTEDYMDRWEAAHPGQKYPGRLVAQEEGEQ